MQCETDGILSDKLTIAVENFIRFFVSANIPRVECTCHDWSVDEESC